MEQSKEEMETLRQKRHDETARKIRQMQMDGISLDSDEVRDAIEEEVFGDNKEGLENLRLKRELEQKAKKGLLSEKEIDYLIGGMLGNDNKLRRDEENKIDIKKAEISQEGIKKNQEYLKKRMEQYHSIENDDERAIFLESLKGKVNSPEVAERNTQAREQRERENMNIQKRTITNNEPVQDSPVI